MKGTTQCKKENGRMKPMCFLLNYGSPQREKLTIFRKTVTGRVDQLFANRGFSVQVAANLSRSGALTPIEPDAERGD
jgi:hypothetical protein